MLRKLISLNYININRFSKAKPLEKKQDISAADQLLKVLQSKQQICLTKDQYQIYIGLFIQRDPIFLRYSDIEMTVKKERYNLMKKYNILPSVSKELHEFNKKIETLGDPNEDVPTHLIIDQQTQDKIYYRGKSRNFKYVDPTITNDFHSIQNASSYTNYLIVKNKVTNNWGFPTMPVEDKYSFEEMKKHMFKKLSENKWNVIFDTRMPRLCQKVDFEKKQGRAKGTKTFFFGGFIQNGEVQVNTEFYNDYAWVTRLQLNQFLSEADYNVFVHALDF